MGMSTSLDERLEDLPIGGELHMHATDAMPQHVSRYSWYQLSFLAVRGHAVDQGPFLERHPCR